jgi:phage-related protein
MALQISGVYRHAKNKLQHGCTYLYEIYTGVDHSSQNYSVTISIPNTITIKGEDVHDLYKQDKMIVLYVRYQTHLYRVKVVITVDSTFDGTNTIVHFRTYNDGTDIIFHMLMDSPFKGRYVKLDLMNVIYLTEYNQPITFTNRYSEYVYSPFPIVFDKIPNNNEFTFSDIGIETSAVSRIIIRYIQSHGGMVGNEVFIYHYFLDEAITDYTDTQIERYFIISSSYDQEKIQIKLNNVHWSKFEVPRRRFIQDYCQWVFKSIECGYPHDGVLEKCDQRLCTANGCMMHDTAALDESLNLNEALKNAKQYERFGAFPGVSNK